MNIIIDIKSKIQQDDGEVHEIDMVTEAEWYEKNNSIFLVYMESELSGMAGSKTMLKVQDDQITMTRFGDASSKIVFNIKEPVVSMYKTPYGDFEMSVFTEVLDHNLKADQLLGNIHLEYRMVLENVSTSHNTLNISIRKNA